MKPTFDRIAFAAALMLFAPSAHAGNWQAVEIIPGHTPTTVTVKEKPRSYFRVSEDSPLALAVEGPARLRLVSRAELPRGADHVVSYGVRVLEQGVLLKQQFTESSPAKGVAVAGDHTVPCKSRSMVVEIPAGSHRLAVSVSGIPSVLIRVLLSSPARGGAKMISITPLEAPRSVTLSEGERLIPYYTTFPGRPVKLRIVGPTSLELSTRLDFDATMRGVHTYRIAVTESGNRIREAAFKTTKATTASYTDLKERSASKVNQVVIPLGAGVHELNVELLEPRNGSAEVHARIPEPSVGRAE